MNRIVGTIIKKLASVRKRSWLATVVFVAALLLAVALQLLAVATISIGHRKSLKARFENGLALTWSRYDLSEQQPSYTTLRLAGIGLHITRNLNTTQSVAIRSHWGWLLLLPPVAVGACARLANWRLPTQIAATPIGKKAMQLKWTILTLLLSISAAILLGPGKLSAYTSLQEGSYSAHISAEGGWIRTALARRLDDFNPGTYAPNYTHEVPHLLAWQRSLDTDLPRAWRSFTLNCSPWLASSAAATAGNLADLIARRTRSKKKRGFLVN